MRNRNESTEARFGSSSFEEKDSKDEQSDDDESLNQRLNESVRMLNEIDLRKHAKMN